MKKIETKEQAAKKSRRNQLFIGIILVGLMIMSTAGYAIMDNDNGGSGGSIDYNGVKFYNQGDSWKFIYNNQQFSTTYNPKEVENISAKISLNLLKYNGKVLYFVTETGQPNNEIYSNLYPFILKPNGACLENETCNGNFPIKDCSMDNIIVLKEPLNNETEGISQEGNCIFIKAYENNQTKFADAFLFKILGI